MWSGRSSNDPPFIGSVDDSSFRIRRDICYRNSFLPFLRGQITPTFNGAHIVVTMFMHPLVAAFMLFWLAEAARIKSLSMFAFGVVLCLGGFIPEAAKAKNLLSTILNAQNTTTGVPTVGK